MKNRIAYLSRTQVEFAKQINDLMTIFKIEKEDVINITMIGQFTYLWYWAE